MIAGNLTFAEELLQSELFGDFVLPTSMEVYAGMTIFRHVFFSP